MAKSTDEIVNIAQAAVEKMIVENNRRLDAAILEFLGFTLEEAQADAIANPDKYEIQHHQNAEGHLAKVIFLNKETQEGVVLPVVDMMYGDAEPYVAG